LARNLFEAVNGHVLIYVHKEEALADVERRYPADHYVMVDDKLRILAALKKAWGDRVTTVFPRQGKFANDPKLLAAFSDSADVSVARISDLLEYSLADLLKPTHTHQQAQPFRQAYVKAQPASLPGGWEG
jgi:hypothetical protein